MGRTWLVSGAAGTVSRRGTRSKGTPPGCRRQARGTFRESGEEERGGVPTARAESRRPPHRSVFRLRTARLAGGAAFASRKFIFTIILK